MLGEDFVVHGSLQSRRLMDTFENLNLMCLMNDFTSNSSSDIKFILEALRLVLELKQSVKVDFNLASSQFNGKGWRGLVENFVYARIGLSQISQSK
jgi:hypothetical protein